MSDKRTTGLYHKFNVTRTDGKSALGEKHDGCDYFVLDLTHDPHARPALRAYAESCRANYPMLATDLDVKLSPTVPIDALAAYAALRADVMTVYSDPHLTWEQARTKLAAAPPPTPAERLARKWRTNADTLEEGAKAEDVDEPVALTLRACAQELLSLPGEEGDR